MTWLAWLGVVLAAMMVASVPVVAQVAPSAGEVQRYEGLHKAAWEGDVAAVKRMVASGADLELRDGNGRTALHVAAFASHDDVVRALAKAGADPNALENGKYDMVTIAAVANDHEMVKTAIEAGNDPGNVTSIYDGTALIAAAHLGNWESIEVLIEAGAPLDHVNNLGWTAVIEAIVLGDGGARHQKSLKLLLDAGADRTIPDRAGQTPLDLAKERGYTAMVEMLQ